MTAARSEAEGMAGLPLLQRVPPPLVITPVPLVMTPVPLVITPVPLVITPVPHVLTPRGRTDRVWRDAVGMRLVRLGLGFGVRG